MRIFRGNVCWQEGWGGRRVGEHTAVVFSPSPLRFGLFSSPLFLPRSFLLSNLSRANCTSLLPFATSSHFWRPAVENKLLGCRIPWDKWPSMWLKAPSPAPLAAYSRLPSLRHTASPSPAFSSLWASFLFRSLHPLTLRLTPVCLRPRRWHPVCEPLMVLITFPASSRSWPTFSWHSVCIWCSSASRADQANYSWFVKHHHPLAFCSVP